MKLQTLLLASMVLFSSCSSFISSSGPDRGTVNGADGSEKVEGIQILDVDQNIAKRLIEGRKLGLFSEVFAGPTRKDYHIGPGDVLEVIVWEAPPRALFSGEAGAVILPHQMVTDQGEINIPFMGQVNVARKSLAQIEKEVIKGLRGKANEPQVMVRVVGNNTNNVIIVGDVNLSRQIPLTFRGEKLLDALALAGGVKQEVNKTTLQVTRGESVHSLPLDTIIKDPKQNILLMPGDVITSLYKSYSYTVLGATGVNAEINFEAQGISLAQALARAGGLQDNRADAKGVFIFRFEKAKVLDFGNKEVKLTPDGKVPVIYKIDMKDPSTFFIAQSFPIEHGDVLYVSNSSQAQLQKFLNLVQSVAISTLGIINLEKNLNPPQ